MLPQDRKKEKSSKSKRKPEIPDTPLTDPPESPCPKKKKGKDEEEEEVDEEEEEVEYKDLEIDDDEEIPSFREFFQSWKKLNGLDNPLTLANPQATNQVPLLACFTSSNPACRIERKIIL